MPDPFRCRAYTASDNALRRKSDIDLATRDLSRRELYARALLWDIIITANLKLDRFQNRPPVLNPVNGSLFYGPDHDLRTGRTEILRNNIHLVNMPSD